MIGSQQFENGIRGIAFTEFVHEVLCPLAEPARANARAVSYVRVKAPHSMTQPHERNFQTPPHAP